MPQNPLDRRALIAGLIGFSAGAAAGATASKTFASQCAPQTANTDGITATVLAEPAPTGTEVSVKLDSGAIQRLPYLAPYVPVPGDRVAVSVVFGGPHSSSVVIGGHSGRSGNLVCNGDFAAVPSVKSRQPPYMWGQQRIAGKSTVVAAMLYPRFQKPGLIIDSYPELAGDNVAYCAAFPVQPGEKITVDASTYMDIVAPMSVQVDVRIAWLADLSGTFAKPLKQDVFMQRQVDVDGEWLFEGEAVVPGGAAAARVGIRAKHQGGDGGQFTLFVGHVYARR